MRKVFKALHRSVGQSVTHFLATGTHLTLLKQNISKTNSSSTTMRLRTALMFLAVCAIILASFQVEAGKKKKIKKIIMKALGKIPQKKILIPLPLPLPLPIPVIVKKQKIYIQESVPYAAPSYGGCGGDGYGCGGGGGGGGGY